MAGKNVPGIPGAYTTRNFTYLARGPWWSVLASPPLDYLPNSVSLRLCHLTHMQKRKQHFLVATLTTRMHRSWNSKGDIALIFIDVGVSLGCLKHISLCKRCLYSNVSCMKTKHQSVLLLCSSMLKSVYISDDCPCVPQPLGHLQNQCHWDPFNSPPRNPAFWWVHSVSIPFPSLIWNDTLMGGFQ